MHHTLPRQMADFLALQPTCAPSVTTSSTSSSSRPAATGCTSLSSHCPPVSAPPVTTHSPSHVSSYVLPMPSPISPLSSPSFCGARLNLSCPFPLLAL